jgi:uncharacterized Ntn-hydrolase superfamily protein
MKATEKARFKKLDKIKAALKAAWDKRDPQAAAEIIVNAGYDQGWAMDAAFDVGFQPEYYGYSIRVHMPE